MRSDDSIEHYSVHYGVVKEEIPLKRATNKEYLELTGNEIWRKKFGQQVSNTAGGGVEAAAQGRTGLRRVLCSTGSDKA